MYVYTVSLLLMTLVKRLTIYYDKLYTFINVHVQRVVGLHVRFTRGIFC